MADYSPDCFHGHQMPSLYKFRRMLGFDGRSQVLQDNAEKTGTPSRSPGPSDQDVPCRSEAYRAVSTL